MLQSKDGKRTHNTGGAEASTPRSCPPANEDPGESKRRKRARQYSRQRSSQSGKSHRHGSRRRDLVTAADLPYAFNR